jgi:hypothetical protein
MRNMHSHFPARSLFLAAGFGIGLLLLGAVFLGSAGAQSGAASSASLTPDQALSAGTAHTDAKGRHLAPRGTFYLLTYVSATTDKGVEGFDPGQEVHLVAVHRPTHTLVVTDGHAQVEVPPSKLTNDLDIAALVRQKDKAKQARITAYIQSEQAAYDKAEQAAADATAKDLEQREQAETAAAARAAAEQTTAEQTPQPIAATVAPNGYYDEGGYGYGSPYSYFVEAPVAAAPRAPATAPVAAAAAAPGKVAAPAAPAEPAGPGRSR